MIKNILLVFLLILCALFVYFTLDTSNENNAAYEAYNVYKATQEKAIDILFGKVIDLDYEVSLKESRLSIQRGEVAYLQKILDNSKAKIKSTSLLLDSTREELLEQNALKDQTILDCFALNFSLVRQDEINSGLVVTLKQEVSVCKDLFTEEHSLRTAAEDALFKINADNKRLAKQNKRLKIVGGALVVVVLIKIIGG